MEQTQTLLALTLKSLQSAETSTESSNVRNIIYQAQQHSPNAILMSSAIHEIIKSPNKFIPQTIVLCCKLLMITTANLPYEKKIPAIHLLNKLQTTLQNIPGDAQFATLYVINFTFRAFVEVLAGFADL
jgi:hypothetical protein